jgi:hypothetical protein
MHLPNIEKNTIFNTLYTMKTRIKDLSVSGYPEHAASSTEVTLLLNVGHHPKYLYSSYCLISKSHLQLPNVCIAHLLHFKLKCDVL